MTPYTSVSSLVPERMFFTKGVGVHKDRLASFELALRKAGIEICNLVYVSSIFPPHCKILPRALGEKSLKPGQITFAVLARSDTCEPNRLIASSIGLALPKDSTGYGYLSEHHSYGETAQIAGDYAEDLAASMLATTLGVKFDSQKAWNERKQVYQSSGKIFKTMNVAQSAEGDKNGLWTTVISAGIFV